MKCPACGMENDTSTCVLCGAHIGLFVPNKKSNVSSQNHLNYKESDENTALSSHRTAPSQALQGALGTADSSKQFLCKLAQTRQAQASQIKPSAGLTVLTLFSLFMFWPLGLFLVWKFTPWQLQTKRIMTAVTIFIVLLYTVSSFL